MIFMPYGKLFQLLFVFSFFRFSNIYHTQSISPTDPPVLCRKKIEKYFYNLIERHSHTNIYKMNTRQPNLSLVLEDDYFDDYGFDIGDLIDFIKCEAYLVVNCEDVNDRKCALERMKIIERELISRYKFIKVKGVRYVVDKEDYQDFKGGVIDSVDLFEVSGYISNKEFKLKNVGCSVGYINEENKVVFSTGWVVEDRPFNMNVSGKKIIFDGGVYIGNLNGEIVGRKLRYLYH